MFGNLTTLFSPRVNDSPQADLKRIRSGLSAEQIHEKKVDMNHRIGSDQDLDIQEIQNYCPQTIFSGATSQGKSSLAAYVMGQDIFPSGSSVVTKIRQRATVVPVESGQQPHYEVYVKFGKRDHLKISDQESKDKGHTAHQQLYSPYRYVSGGLDETVKKRFDTQEQVYQYMSQISDQYATPNYYDEIIVTKYVDERTRANLLDLPGLPGKMYADFKDCIFTPGKNINDINVTVVRMVCGTGPGVGESFVPNIVINHLEENNASKPLLVINCIDDVINQSCTNDIACHSPDVQEGKTKMCRSCSDKMKQFHDVIVALRENMDGHVLDIYLVQAKDSIKYNDKLNTDIVYSEQYTIQFLTKRWYSFFRETIDQSGLIFGVEKLKKRIEMLSVASHDQKMYKKIQTILRHKISDMTKSIRPDVNIHDGSVVVDSYLTNVKSNVELLTRLECRMRHFIRETSVSLCDKFQVPQVRESIGDEARIGLEKVGRDTQLLEQHKELVRTFLEDFTHQIYSMFDELDVVFIKYMTQYLARHEKKHERIVAAIKQHWESFKTDFYMEQSEYAHKTFIYACSSVHTEYNPEKERRRSIKNVMYALNMSDKVSDATVKKMMDNLRSNAIEESAFGVMPTYKRPKNLSRDSIMWEKPGFEYSRYLLESILGRCIDQISSCLNTEITKSYTASLSQYMTRCVAKERTLSQTDVEDVRRKINKMKEICTDIENLVQEIQQFDE